MSTKSLGAILIVGGIMYKCGQNLCTFSSSGTRIYTMNLDLKCKDLRVCFPGGWKLLSNNNYESLP